MAAGRLPDEGRGINADRRFMLRKPEGWREALPLHPLSVANDDFGWVRRARREGVGDGHEAFHSIAPALRRCVWHGLEPVRAQFFGKLDAQLLNAS